LSHLRDAKWLQLCWNLPAQGAQREIRRPKTESRRQ